MNDGLWAEFDKSVPYFYTVNVGYRTSRDRDLSYVLKSTNLLGLTGLTKPKQLAPTNLIKWSE